MNWLLQAIRLTVKIKSGGRIEILASELNEGLDAEVIVLMQEPTLMEAQDLPMQESLWPRFHQCASIAAISPLYAVEFQRWPAKYLEFALAMLQRT